MTTSMTSRALDRSNPIAWLPCAALLSACAGTTGGADHGAPLHAVAWPIDNVANVAGYELETLGQPRPAGGSPSPSVCFAGQDGLVFPVNPLDAQPEYTIQVLFKPDPAGPAKQQFLHLQDGSDNRVLMEIRLAPDGRWYLHSFVRSGKQEQELAAPELVHDAAAWYWVALTYRDGELSQFVNARRQAFAMPSLVPMRRGNMSVGIRLSAENGFKGCVRELRFATAALPATELARDVDAPSVLARVP